MKKILFLLFAWCAVGLVQAQNNPEWLTRNGKVYCYHDSIMTQAEMVAFIQQNCDKAYQHYRKNKNLEIAGWSLFGAGVGMSVGMGIGFLGGAIATNIGIYQTCAFAFFGAGTVVGITGIPMIIVGNVRKKELKLISDANGLGLALAF
jgi:hypothetical protein